MSPLFAVFLWCVIGAFLIFGYLYQLGVFDLMNTDEDTLNKLKSVHPVMHTRMILISGPLVWIFGFVIFAFVILGLIGKVLINLGKRMKRK